MIAAPISLERIAEAIEESNRLEKEKIEAIREFKDELNLLRGML